VDQNGQPVDVSKLDVGPHPQPGATGPDGRPVQNPLINPGPGPNPGPGGAGLPPNPRP
jgi:hypothetical protein